MQSSQFHFFLTYKAIKYLRMVGILDETQSVGVYYDGRGHGWLPCLLSLTFRGQWNLKYRSYEIFRLFFNPIRALPHQSFKVILSIEIYHLSITNYINTLKTPKDAVKVEYNLWIKCSCMIEFFRLVNIYDFSTIERFWGCFLFSNLIVIYPLLMLRYLVVSSRRWHETVSLIKVIFNARG